MVKIYMLRYTTEQRYRLREESLQDAISLLQDWMSNNATKQQDLFLKEDLSMIKVITVEKDTFFLNAEQYKELLSFVKDCCIKLHQVTNEDIEGLFDGEVERVVPVDMVDLILDGKDE